MTLVLDRFGVAIGRRRIVDGVAASLSGGTVLALLGRNGAGKTTLLRGLAGLLPATGSARLDGTELVGLPPGPRARLVGYMAQDLGATSARLSTLELLLLAQNGGRTAWTTPAESLRRAEAAMDLLGLHRFGTRPPGELSGGQRQMVLLALALVRQPRLLLLDEPTSALDLSNQLHLLRAVRDYTRREGIATVAILHDLSLAARFADTVLMLDGGRVSHAGPVATTVTEPVIGAVYGVSCRVLPVGEGGLRAVYPLEPLAPQGEGPA